MKRILLTLSFAALALSGCIQDEVLDNGGGSETDAVEFGTYIGRSAATRATVITSETLKGEGFGVNAWYTGLDPFDPDKLSDEYDVFMNNTRVAHDGTAWAYSPLKYWPNNPNEMVSFVAYAPHVVDADGNTNDNIVISGKDLTYTVANEVKEQVDLLWSDSNESDDYNTIDLKKQTVDDKVTFLFKHALSKINLKVGALIDMVEDDTTDSELGTDVLAPETEIKVKKVVLMGGDDTYQDTEDWLISGGPFYTGGTLSLTDGTWSGQTGGQRFEFTAEHFYYNTDFVLDQNNSNYLNDLLNDESYLMIIPQDLTTGGFKIYIEYDVITQDEAVSDGSVVVENRITSADAITSIDFEQGKQYNINMILGMTTVKFDVEVTDWDPADDTDSDNPANKDEEGGADDTDALQLNYNRLNMNVGDSKQILATNIPSGLATKSVDLLSYECDNEGVVSVDEEGNVFAENPGTVRVTVSYEGFEEAVCAIDVLPVIKPVTLTDPIETSNIPAADVVWRMGRLDDWSENNPTHYVKLTQDYYMGQYEINRGQFLEFLNANTECFRSEDGFVVFTYYEEGYETIDYICPEGANDFTYSGGTWSLSTDTAKWPVQTEWAGAQLFAQSVGGALPSEAQWEYACRSGSDDLSENVWWESILTDETFYKYFDESEGNLEEQIADYEKIILSYENLSKCVIKYEQNGEFDEYGGSLYDIAEMSYDFSLRSEGETIYANPWGLYDLYGSLPEYCSNFFYDYPVKAGEPGESASNPLVDPDGRNAEDQATHTIRGAGGERNSYDIQYYDEEIRSYILIQPFADSYFRNVTDGYDGLRVIFYDTTSPNNVIKKSDNLAPASY